MGMSGLGMPSWLPAIAGLGINAARGSGINPLQALMTLGRLAGGIGNG
jgi:hypothetical protein